MAGKMRNLLNRDGRYFARLVVPKELRQFVGKTELRTPIGPDYREAVKKLPGAVALLQHEIALAERRAVEAGQKEVTLGRYPLAPDQIALRNYQARLAFDEEVRNADHRYALLDVADYNDPYVRRLRDGFSGSASDDELQALVGSRIERFRQLGNTIVERGTAEWRTLARMLCVAEYEALARVQERNEGDWTGAPTHPVLANVQPDAEDMPPVSLKGLLADYIQSRIAVGKGRGIQQRWTPVFSDLVKFVGHDDARTMTKKNILDWRDQKLRTLSPKTVADVYLASVRAVFSWAVQNDRLDANVTEKVRQDVPRKQRSREQGFTLTEATAILRAARDYSPTLSGAPSNELPQTVAAKRWVPFLCAFSGARVTEITQLRKEDFRSESDALIMRIRPDAGTVKVGHFRDIPIHAQITEMGFKEFLNKSPAGPLFYRADRPRDSVKASRMVAGRISEWLQSLALIPEGVAPNHGWRHRFKTVGVDEGVSTRVIDAIQGHAPKTAGDNYGDVTLKARIAAINKFPYYRLG